MQLFYNPDISTSSETVIFNKEESRHIIRSLRKSLGENLNITDGSGKLFTAEILQANDKKCIAKVKNWQDKTTGRTYHLHMAVAPTKLNDRYEWFLEKATEIGVDEITPVICEHSERRQLKNERMEKVLVSAMKQSVKFHLPTLNKPEKYKDFLRRKNWDLGLIAHCDQGKKDQLSSYFPFHQRIMILIGPEGDFSSEEIRSALDMNIKPVTFGESRLRTETAGIVACTSVALLNENS